MPTPVLIDCDPGIDDSLALMLACASPELDLLGVTTVCGNVGVDQGTRNALAVLALAGRGDVPVAAGADRPLVRHQPQRATEVHGEDGIGGVALAASLSTVDGRVAPRFLADKIRESERPVTLLAVGPLTNVALLFASYPAEAAALDRLVVLGGATGSGNVTPAAEFNVWTDPEAAYRVLSDPGLASVPPTVLIGLEVTGSTAVDRTGIERLRAGGPVGEPAARMLDFYLRYYGAARGHESVVVHDAVAVAEAIRPGVIHTAARAVTVDYSDGPDRGRTVVDQRPTGHRVDVGVGADAGAVTEMIVARIAGYDPHPPPKPPIG